MTNVAIPAYPLETGARAILQIRPDIVRLMEYVGIRRAAMAFCNLIWARNVTMEMSILPMGVLPAELLCFANSKFTAIRRATKRIY
jgi:hypothetical protein